MMTADRYVTAGDRPWGTADAISDRSVASTWRPDDHQLSRCSRASRDGDSTQPMDGARRDGSGLPPRHQLEPTETTIRR
jgi:hypothetical protein